MAHEPFVAGPTAGLSVFSKALLSIALLSMLASPCSALEEWQPMGPDGAHLISIAPSAADSDLIFAGGFLRPYRSLDGGESWELAGEPDFTFRAHSIAPHPTDTEVVLAGIETFNLLDPVWRSEDGGQSWVSGSTGLPVNGIVLSLFHDPSAPTVVYALLSEDGPYRSTDGGQTWTALDVEDVDLDVVTLRQLLRGDQGQLYLVGTGLGMLVSLDEGASWTSMNEGLDNLNFFQVALAPSAPGTFYAIGVGEIFRWRDGGPWQELLVGSPPGSVEKLLVDPDSSSTIWVAGSEGIYQTFASDNLPTLWIGEATGLETAGSVNDLVLVGGDFARAGSLAATDAGAAIRQADRTWNEKRSGLRGVDVAAMLPIDTGEQTEILAFDGTILTSPYRFRRNLDRGAAWSQESVIDLPANGLVDLVAAPPLEGTGSPDRLFAATTESLLRSRNGGASWQAALLPDSVSGLSALAFGSSPDPGGEELLYLASLGSPSTLLRSFDGGESFFTTSRPGDNAVRALAADPRDPRVVYAATEGSEQVAGGLYRSDDAGDSWNAIALPLSGDEEADEDGAFAIDIVPATEDGEGPWIYVGLGFGRIAISSDGGETWSLSQPPLIGEVLFVVADPHDPSRVYCGDLSSLLRTTDGGNNWSAGPTLPAGGTIYDLAIDPRAPAQVYVSIAGSGVYRATFPAENATYLQRERFETTVRWNNGSGGEGAGRPVSLTADTGYFWFFDAANVELILKVLDGRALNGNFWVFYGALSNTEYAIRVVDLDTGIESVYSNPRGTFASIGDLGAFPAPAFLAPDGPDWSEAARLVSDPPVARNTTLRALPLRLPDSAPTKVDEPCVTDAEHLCLAAERFRVEVDWKTPDGGEGRGQAAPLTADTGYFWFFDSNNVEVVAKVLDARVLNGHFWVFYGALSNVEYTLRVTDTMTGTEWRYSNPLDTFASGGDVEAFPDP